jgi:predicted TIM-barrel fold metal-dependent hydrolase
MGYIDCDTHILENDETWTYLDPAERIYKPQKIEFTEQNAAPENNQTSKTFWIAGDSFARLQPPDSRPAGFGKQYSAEVTWLDDVSRRLEDMDLLGVDVQVIISTFFIGIEMENPLADAALCRSWNRWAAERTSDARGRLPWLAVVPTRSMDRTIAEMRFAREHGAVGVFLNGQEASLYLNDPYFYPMYEVAQELDLAMCVHVGGKVRRIRGLSIGNVLPTQAAFMDHLSPLMAGFWAVLSSDLDQRFPALRWSYLEGGATWAPAVFQQQQRLTSTNDPDAYEMTDRGINVTIAHLPAAELMAQKNLYIACEADEDLPYLVSLLGEGALVSGSDYGHNDIGSEPLAHSVIAGRADLSAEAAHRILDTNGRKLFGIAADFTPADKSPQPVGQAG